MRFLVLFALVAAASADYHDDTFHFSTLSGSKSGGSFLKAGKQFASFKALAQPAYSQQYAAVSQVSAPAPFLVQQQVPVPVQPVQYTVQQVAQPAFFAQPALFQAQYAQPAVIAQTHQYAAAHSAPQYRILSHVQETDPSGPYKLSYSTENGIQVQEEGALIGSAEGPVVAAQGSYSYTGPDGVVYSVSYVADENGFRAAGDHLPTPPPIPAEILKSLEENAASGEQYDDQGRLLKK